MWINILTLLGSLALLMFGMKQMSESLQKMAGSQLRHVLGTMTKNRFTGMLTGIFVTASVQSSTATTVMTVSFVNAGLLSLAQAISVIMGANIGTTLTAWIMSAGLLFDIKTLAYIGFFLAIILIYSKKRGVLGDFIFGLGFMLLGLGTLKATGADMHLEQNPSVIAFFQTFDPQSFWTTLIFLLIGSVLTMCVQSSAAVMAITMILCSSGVLPIYQGIALVLGENIGTTVTSNIIALSANTQARRAALAHMFFNVFGVIWVLILFRPFVNMVCGMVGCDPNNVANKEMLTVVLAAFHTTFNVVNTFILIWFIPQIEKFVCRVIKPKKKKEDEDDFKLQFISTGILETPELSLLEAQKEITYFGERMQKMFGLCQTLLALKNEDFVKMFTRIQKYEDISDRMEIEIAHYLDQVSEAHLSPETKGKVRAMLREISELESIGDSCFNIARTINRKLAGNEHFTIEQKQRMHQMFLLVQTSLEQMNELLSGRKSEFDVNKSFNIEHEINNYRNQLKSQNISDINNHEYDYAIGTMYMDVISECEKLGDYVINVVEARMGSKRPLSYS